jgi:hypothetical protein
MMRTGKRTICTYVKEVRNQNGRKRVEETEERVMGEGARKIEKEKGEREKGGRDTYIDRGTESRNVEGGRIMEKILGERIKRGREIEE